jgi:hypothetical protein
MLQPAGEADAGSAGERPAGDRRLGRRMAVEEERFRSASLLAARGGADIRSPRASENSCLPEASGALIRERHPSSSR